MSDIVAGIDCGTTRLKVGLFDLAGECLAVAERDCPPHHSDQGRLVVNTDRWSEALDEAMVECLARVDRRRLRALAVSSQAQTYVLLNAAREPLGPALSWLDDGGDAKGTAKDLAGFDYAATTGVASPNRLLAACKLRRHAREQGWNSVAQILFADGFLLQRLTGCPAVSRNLAAMSGLYSLPDKAWWPEALAAAGVPERLLPRLFDAGEPVGWLAPEWASRWGVADVAVAAGANDQTCAALGVGLSEAAQVTVGLGTALVVYQLLPDASPWSRSAQFQGPYPGGLGYRIGLWDTGCASLEWARNLTAPGLRWEELLDEALAVAPGAEGLRARPEFSGGGCLCGLRLCHTRAHVVRAILEGLACALRQMLEAFQVIGRVRVTGGGARHDGWMQLLSDVTGRALERADVPHASVRGAALLAGCASGGLPHARSAIRSWRRPGRVFEPCSDHQPLYEQAFQSFLKGPS